MSVYWVDAVFLTYNTTPSMCAQCIIPRLHKNRWLEQEHVTPIETRSQVKVLIIQLLVTCLATMAYGYVACTVRVCTGGKFYGATSSYSSRTFLSALDYTNCRVQNTHLLALYPGMVRIWGYLPVYWPGSIHHVGHSVSDVKCRLVQQMYLWCHISTVSLIPSMQATVVDQHAACKATTMYDQAM